MKTDTRENRFGYGAMMVVEGSNEMYDFIPRWRGLFRVCYADIYTVARKYCDTCGESVMNLEKIFFKL